MSHMHTNPERPLNRGVMVQSVGGHGHGASGDPGAHRSPMITAVAAQRNVDNARAIENGILWMTVIPMFIKFVLYGVSPNVSCHVKSACRDHLFRKLHFCLQPLLNRAASKHRCAWRGYEPRVRGPLPCCGICMRPRKA